MGGEFHPPKQLRGVSCLLEDEMKVLRTADKDQMGLCAARIMIARILAALKRKLNVCVGTATGNTQTSVYEAFVELARELGLPLGRLLFFMLDEYRNLEPGDPRTFFEEMKRKLFSHLDIPNSRIFLPATTNLDRGRLHDSFMSYESQISARQGVDLWLLGLGTHGHVAFCEHEELVELGLEAALATRTREVCLPERTRRDNAGEFGGNWEDVPAYAVTVGIANILEAHALLVTACGSAKAEAVARLLEGEVTPEWPCSLLRRHENLTVVVDAEAAAGINEVVCKQWVPEEDELSELLQAS